VTFDPARPRYTLPLAGKEYELLGNMALIESVEYALKKGAGDITVEVVNGMPTHELAKLLHAILTACGQKTTHAKVGEILWNEVGLAGDANSTLRMHLFAFLSICLAPPGDRGRKADEMGELFGRLEKASRGRNTKKPA
jgi:hypothetical protein